MKHHPIIFSTPMVQAILQGRKTQTRTVVKEPFQSWMNTAQNPDWWVEIPEQCPYGQPGDLLWVREPFAEIDHPELKHRFKADHLNPTSVKWKPSIHLPKTAARIWLQITQVSVQRLQQISNQDAIAEGITTYNSKGTPVYKSYLHQGALTKNPTNSFFTLWQSIYGPESFHQNPWVWAIKFNVLSITGYQAIEKP